MKVKPKLILKFGIIKDFSKTLISVHLMYMVTFTQMVKLIFKTDEKFCHIFAKNIYFVKKYLNYIILFTGEFGSLEWSQNEEKVVYIAEKKAKKAEPFYKQKSADASKDQNKDILLVG